MDARLLIRPAVAEGDTTWADFGAGPGTFTRALASLLGARGRVIAVERDRNAIDALGRLARAEAGAADIIVAPGDFLDIDAIPELYDARLDGALFANALHFVADPVSVLAAATRLLRPEGRIAVIEYDRTRANPWVPHPLPPGRLADLARAAGLAPPEVVARRPSAWHREMYLALLSPLVAGGTS